jgi:class 3 adenylate cyclase/tetratricopeptide (TPR) repeat protein
VTGGASTATVVFTDLIGAAALRARLGEDRADALRRAHDRILRARVEAGGGQVLKSQGDGMVAAFPSASDALTATVRVQQAMVRYNSRPDALGELSLRIGVSSGDVSWEGGDCFGTPMVEAARLVAVADPGQILCSGFVRMMARSRGGHEFSDVGLLELKGLPEPLAACALQWAPAPDLAVPLPAEIGAGTDRPFVSRAAELALADSVLSEEGPERACVLWLLGEPGIGKTRLAGEIAGRAYLAGNLVLFGRCNEDLTVPYQPFLEALRFFTTHVPEEELLERLGDSAGELARLLPGLADRLPRDEPTRAGGTEAEQYRLFEAVRSWLAAAGGHRRVVLVIDDLHWAAQPTLQLLGHVARSADPSRLVVVGTARNTSPDDNEALADLVEDLDRKGVPSRRLELGGLGPDDVAELVSSAAGRRLDERLRKLAADVTAETAGNPLFVDVVLRSLPADPTGHAGELPRSVAETVRQRVSRLPRDVHYLLRAASVIGLDFELGVAARVSEQTELDALEGLETAGRAGLVAEVGVDRYRFAHALVRAALREELSLSRRVRLHLAVADAIEALHNDELEEHAAALAYHCLEAVPAGGAERAYRYAVLAAERAVRVFAFDEAADSFGRALDVLDQAGERDPHARARLLLAKGKAHRDAGDFLAALEVLDQAAVEARRVQSVELLAESALAFENASFEPGFLGYSALALLEEARAALGDGESRLHILVTAGLARALEFSGRFVEGAREGDRALAMARRLDDPEVTAHVLCRMAFRWRRSVVHAGTLRDLGIELHRLASDAGDDDQFRYGAWFGFYGAAQLGDLEAAGRWLEEFESIAWRTAPWRWEWLVMYARMGLALLAGDLGLAQQFFDELQKVEPPRGIDADGAYGVANFLIRREQGRLAGLAPVLRAMMKLRPDAAWWGPGLSAIYAELGLLDEARAELERLGADDFAAVPDDGLREQCLAFLAEVAFRTGAAEHAAGLFDKLRPTEGKLLLFWGNQACLGPADRLLGMLASTAGRVDEADEWFERATAFCRRLPSPLWLAHCLDDHAVHRRRAGRPGSEELLAEAAVLCGKHGLIGLGQKIERSAGYPYAASEGP